ncbi:GNAT family N-acetyltransferase (fragment) [Hyella patelloides LEGE 07179]|uniref:GNAT family N-acetyltransferase n=1 Tax=Hyella patelloides LEGE 07179 TaxID=945734 RepID=A0A563VLD0_9CYAN
MQIEHFENIDCYYKTVKDYLLQQEATHCWMLGIGSRKHFTQQPYLAVVTENNTVLATAIKTPPPDELVLSKSGSENAIAIIARDLVSRGESLPGVIAPKPEALTFAQMWQSLTGKSYRLGLAQRIYQLEVVNPVNKTNGYLRLATKSDRATPHFVRSPFIN